MILTVELRKTGNWLFKYRGILPVILLLAGLIFLFFHIRNQPVTPPLGYEILCLLIGFAGLLIRILTIGHTPKNTSGRNTKSQKAEDLNTTGIYSTLRHPLYLGNFFMWLGLAMFLYNALFVILSILVFWLYYERIMIAEEAYLQNKFGQKYIDWASRTPAFIPSFKNYTAPALWFSWKNVLKREYNGFGNLIFSFTLIETFRSYFLAEKFHLPTRWIVIFAVGFMIWILLRTLEKNTRLFEVEGR
ncbi:MAG TPA: DUF1295 domain-containing protein [Bacteroidetes bacterium]|nr:DUF1295 domain-containing protein [Bacteroidota bacterium]